MGISDNIKRARKRAKLTQKQLAEKAGLSIASIQGYEQGKYSPKKETIIKIADALEIDVYILDPSMESSVSFVTRKLRCINGLENEVELLYKQIEGLDNTMPIKYMTPSSIIALLMDIQKNGKISERELSFREKEELNTIISDLVSYLEAIAKTDQNNTVEKIKINLFNAQIELIKKYMTLLNETGRKEAVKRISELTEIPYYQSDRKIPEFQRSTDPDPE